MTDSPIGSTNTLALDASDVRYVKSGTLFGQTTLFGIDVNNTPTVQDVWNGCSPEEIGGGGEFKCQDF